MPVAWHGLGGGARPYQPSGHEGDRLASVCAVSGQRIAAGAVGDEAAQVGAGQLADIGVDALKQVNCLPRFLAPGRLDYLLVIRAEDGAQRHGHAVQLADGEFELGPGVEPAAWVLVRAAHLATSRSCRIWRLSLADRPPSMPFRAAPTGPVPNSRHLSMTGQPRQTALASSRSR